MSDVLMTRDRRPVVTSRGAVVQSNQWSGQGAQECLIGLFLPIYAIEEFFLLV